MKISPYPSPPPTLITSLLHISLFCGALFSFTSSDVNSNPFSHELCGQHPLQLLSWSSSLLSHTSIPSFLLHPYSFYLSPHTIVITDAPTLLLWLPIQPFPQSSGRLLSNVEHSTSFYSFSVSTTLYPSTKLHCLPTTSFFTSNSSFRFLTSPLHPASVALFYLHSHPSLLTLPSHQSHTSGLRCNCSPPLYLFIVCFVFDTGLLCELFAPVVFVYCMFRFLYGSPVRLSAPVVFDYCMFCIWNGSPVQPFAPVLFVLFVYCILSFLIRVSCALSMRPRLDLPPLLLLISHASRAWLCFYFHLASSTRYLPVTAISILWVPYSIFFWVLCNLVFSFSRRQSHLYGCPTHFSYWVLHNPVLFLCRDGNPMFMDALLIPLLGTIQPCFTFVKTAIRILWVPYSPLLTVLLGTMRPCCILSQDGNLIFMGRFWLSSLRCG